MLHLGHPYLLGIVNGIYPPAFRAVSKRITAEIREEAGTIHAALKRYRYLAGVNGKMFCDRNSEDVIR